MRCLRVFVVGSCFGDKYLAAKTFTADNNLARSKINFRKKVFEFLCLRIVKSTP